MSRADLHRTMHCRSALQTPAYIYTHNTWSFRSSPSHPRPPVRVRRESGSLRRCLCRSGHPLSCCYLPSRKYSSSPHHPHRSYSHQSLYLPPSCRPTGSNRTFRQSSAVLSASHRSSDNIYPHRPSQARADARRSHQNNISFRQLSSSRSLFCRICNNSTLHWT